MHSLQLLPLPQLRAHGNRHVHYHAMCAMSSATTNTDSVCTPAHCTPQTAHGTQLCIALHLASSLQAQTQPPLLILDIHNAQCTMHSAHGARCTTTPEHNTQQCTLLHHCRRRLSHHSLDRIHIGAVSAQLLNHQLRPP